MTGWKTKTGSIVMALGGVLTASADGCPVAEWVPWLKWLGGVMLALGAALGVYGIGHKVDKATGDA